MFYRDENPSPPLLEKSSVWTVWSGVFMFLFTPWYRLRFCQDFFLHVSLLLKRRLPLHEGIERMVPRYRNTSLRTALSGIARSTRQGTPLHEAVAPYCPSLFRPKWLPVIRAGEVSGRTGQAMEYLVTDGRFEREANHHALWAMGLLSLLYTESVVVILLISTFVLPRYVEFYFQAGVALPSVTGWVVESISGVATLVALLVPVLVLLFLVLMVNHVGLIGVPVSFLPGFRATYRRYRQGRFLAVLGLLLEGGVPAAEAVGIAGDSISLRKRRERIGDAVDRIRRGIALSEALGDLRILDARTLWLVRSAERTGDLPRTLIELGEEDTIRGYLQWRNRFQVLKVFAILVVGSVEALIAIGMYTPLFELPLLIPMD